MPLRQLDPATKIGPIGPVLTRGKKYLWWVVSTAVSGSYVDAFDEGAPIDPAQLSSEDNPAHEWRRFIVDFEDVASDAVQDNQQLTFDVMNWTAGLPDSSWTDTDYANVAGAFATHLWTPISPYTAPHIAVAGYRAYVQKFNPYTITDRPLAASGPPDWTVDVTDSPGSGTGPMAAQVCTAVTEITTIAGHYGRFYLPTLAGNAFATDGRLTVAAVDAIANAASAFMDALYDQEYVPIVVTTTVDRSAKRVLSNVRNVAVDDVPDVIRRRRLRNVLHRAERGV